MSRAKRRLAGIALALAVMCPMRAAIAMSVDPVILGTASGFAALAGSGISFAGSAPTTLHGDIGGVPSASITGMANLLLDGVNHADDAVAQNARGALLTAYNDAAGRTPTTLYGAVFDLGERTLDPGVYNGSSSFGITGTLTLDAGGDPNAVWIFQAGSTLTLATGSRIVLVGGAQAANVFWQVGSSATLGTDAYFVGSLLALTSITLNTGATAEGRMLALNGAVTFDNNVLTVPEPGTFHLLVIGLSALAIAGRRFKASEKGSEAVPSRRLS
jgi:hypothetical protein